MGAFDGDDTRTFALAAVDNAGNVSSKTATLVGVPVVSGKTLADATPLLTARSLGRGRGDDGHLERGRRHGPRTGHDEPRPELAPPST